MKFPESMLLKLPVGSLERIDAVCENRSDWIRGLIDAALSVPGTDAPLSGLSKKAVGQISREQSLAPKEPVFIKGSSSEAAKMNRPSREPARQRHRSTVPSPRAADKAALLELIKLKPISSRDAEREMNWLGLRFSKAEQGLSSDGLIAFEGGLFYAT